jgi:hypothetical protein
MLFVGDSVADTLAGALATAAAPDGVEVLSRVRSGCGMSPAPVVYGGTDQVIPWTPSCADGFEAYVHGALEETHPDVVLWLSTWEAGDVLVAGRVLHLGTPESDAWLLADMDDVRRQVDAVGARLVFVTNAPTAPNPRAPVAPDNAVRLETLNALYHRFADLHPDDTGVADLAPLVCPGGPPCPTAVDGVVLRPVDGGHYEGGGPAWVAPRLLPLIYDALRGIDDVRTAADEFPLP